MTPLTWAVVVVLAAIVVGTVLRSCRVAAQDDRRAAYENGMHQQRLRDAMHTEAHRLYPDGDDNKPWPCSHEDGWCVCQPSAERVGKHRAVWQGSLDNQPRKVIIQAVTDVPYRRRPR